MFIVCFLFTEEVELHLKLFTQKVDLLKDLFSLVPQSKNVSLYEDDDGCAVLDIGLYSTLTLPTQKAFGTRCVSGLQRMVF